MDDATYLDKIDQVARDADLRSIHFLAWRDLDDPEAGGSERTIRSTADATVIGCSARPVATWSSRAACSRR
jgi:hypothetical protein